MIRLLLVDDDRLVRVSLRRWLSRYATVDEAENVEGAMRYLEQNRYDVVVSDHAMPDGTGCSLLEVVRDRWPATRRVLVSGEDGACAAAQEFYVKPKIEGLIEWLAAAKAKAKGSDESTKS